MKAERIVWQWCSIHITPPVEQIQTCVQNMAMGVIHAHQAGNVSPVDERRTEERITENTFDPAGGKGIPEAPDRKLIKDCIFSMGFLGMMVYMEIFHCWNSISMPSEEGESKEQDTGCYYLVVISEVLSSPQTPEVRLDPPEEG